MKRASKIACFTICSNNYIASAKVFTSSFAHHHPDVDRFVCLADRRSQKVEYSVDADIVAAEELGIPDFHSLAFRYNVLEFNTAVKPFMFLWLLSRGYDAVLYFDPDIAVYAPLIDVFDALEGGASFVLTPHLCAPAPDWAPRTDIDILQTGIFNLGFVACSKSPESEQILRWWARRLTYECVVDTPRGLFVDQKFMDLIPAFSDSAVVLRAPGYNIAYWNVAQRLLEGHDGSWTVDGAPLRFFHFSGFDPRQPDRLSKYFDPKGGVVSTAVGRILVSYAIQLMDAGYADARVMPYGYDHFASGKVIPDAVRRFFRDKHPHWWGDPFENFEEYLLLPDPGSARGSSGYPVTNLMCYARESREDLRQQFDLGSAESVDAFRDWWKEHAGDLRLERAVECGTSC